MADNSTLNPGVGGDTVAMDDVGGVKFQRVKQAIGADGVAADSVPVSNGMDVTGATVPAAGIVGQFDDVATGTVTENQFAPVRISSRRAMLVEGVASGTAVNTSTVLTEGSAAIGKLAANTGVDIGDVDVTSVVPGSGATNLGKATDAAAGANDVGVAPLAVRDDALSALTPVEGDYVPLRTDSTGRLWVSATIDAALPAGSAAIGKLAANDGVDIGNVDVTTVVPGVGATNLGIAQDDAVSATKVGVLMMAKQSSTPANVAGTNGDAEALQMSAGKLWVLQRGIQTSAGVDMTDTTNNALKVSVVADSVGSATDTEDGTVSTGQSTVALTLDMPYEFDGTNWTRQRGGHTVAHGAADAGNPDKIGAVIETSPKGLTLQDDGDRTNLYADADGILITKSFTSYADIITTSQNVADTTTTAATGFGAVASTKNFITAITVWNSSAQAGYLKIQDGSGGTTFWAMPCPAGGGSTMTFNPPIKQPTANTALYFAASAAMNTLYVSINGFQSKVV
jgi:hypothetical protein